MTKMNEKSFGMSMMVCSILAFSTGILIMKNFEENIIGLMGLVMVYVGAFYFFKSLGTIINAGENKRRRGMKNAKS